MKSKDPFEVFREQVKGALEALVIQTIKKDEDTKSILFRAAKVRAAKVGNGFKLTLIKGGK